MSLALDSRLGPYKVLAHLGTGAMGDVYRAHDTRLNREVAVKVIGAGNAKTAGPRFEQEARAASALNHPNILTVHDIGQEDGRAFIITELVVGESLRTVLGRGPLPMRKLLPLAIQIADGLAAAHDAGIVHRDLKPENIMITRDERVKILDFGLAKFTTEQVVDDKGRTLGENDTAPGLLMGTAAYMSPEQALGGNVRAQSDQFSFGVILYEMATGRQAFRRETALQTLSAILTENAPDLTAGSAPFQWLIKRCLHKDPDHRYGSTRSLLRELEIIQEHLSNPSLPAIQIQEQPPEPKSKSALYRRMLAALALMAAAAAGFLLARLSGPSTVRARSYVPSAATSAIELFPSWSPNGKTIAYAADSEGIFQIHTRSLGGPMAAQLTRSKSDCFFPFWSPDGARVYYISDWSGQSALWSVGSTGGTPEVVLENVAQAAIAPDGRTIAALRQTSSGYAIFKGSLEKRTLQPLQLEPLQGRNLQVWSYLRFSPDGRHLGAWLSLADGTSGFWLVPTKEGSPRPLFESLNSSPLAREFSWMPDSSAIVYAERTGLSVGSHLHKAVIGTGHIEPLTEGSGSEFSPSVSRDGARIAYASVALNYDVVRVSLDTGAISEVAGGPLFEVSPATSPKGEFAYVTDRANSPEIWLRNPQGWERPLVRQEAFADDQTQFIFDTAFSPDGSRVAYRRAGSHDESIWISTITGDPPVRLTPGKQTAFQRGPTWSPDGNTVAYFSSRAGKDAIMSARAGGFEPPVLVGVDAGAYPRWSPRGEWIAGLGPDEGITLISPDGRSRRKMGTGSWLVHGWSDDARRIYGVKMASGELLLCEIAVDASTERVLATIGPAPAGFSYGRSMGILPLRGFALEQSGRSFLTSVLRLSSDVWRIE